MTEFAGSEPIGGVKVMVEFDETPYQKGLSNLKSRIAKNEGMPRLAMASTAQQAFAARWGMNGGGGGEGGGTAPGGYARAQWGPPTGRGRNSARPTSPASELYELRDYDLAEGKTYRQKYREAEASKKKAADEAARGAGGAAAAGTGRGGGFGRNTVTGAVLGAIGIRLTAAAIAAELSRAILNGIAQTGPAMKMALTSQQSSAAYARGDSVMGAKYAAQANRQIIDMTRSIPIIGGAEASTMESMPAAVRWMEDSRAGKAVAMATGLSAHLYLAKRAGIDLRTDPDAEAAAQEEARGAVRENVGGFGGYFGRKRQLQFDKAISDSNIADMKARGVSASTIGVAARAADLNFQTQGFQLQFDRDTGMKTMQLQMQSTMAQTFGMGLQSRLLAIKAENYSDIQNAKLQGDTQLASQLEARQSGQLLQATLGGRRIAQQFNPMDQALSFGSVRANGLSGQDPDVIAALMRIAENTNQTPPAVVPRN